MTLTAVFFFVVGLALAVLVGIGIAAYRLKGELHLSLAQAFMQVFSGPRQP